MAKAGAANGEAKPWVNGEARGAVVKAWGVEMAGLARGKPGPLRSGLERTVGTPWPVGLARTELRDGSIFESNKVSSAHQGTKRKQR